MRRTTEVAVARIQQVARLAGVSVTTVSNVLNGRESRMRPETRARVEHAIKELKYTPNAIAQQLKSGKNRTMGLMVPSVANPFWGEVAHHIERAASRHDYNLLIGNTKRNPDVEAEFSETLLASGVRCAILGSAHLPFAHFDGLVERGMLLASFGGRPDPENNLLSASVSVDFELVGRLSAMHLLGLGHRRIAVLSGKLNTQGHLSRLSGIRGALKQAGVDLSDDLTWAAEGYEFTDDNDGLDFGRMGMRELLSLADPPTAVIAMNDIYALGAYSGAADLGYAVPKDVSVIGFDDILFASVMQPQLTTIRQPVEQMADSLVAALVWMMERPDAKGGEAHSVIAPRLVVRSSTAPPGPGPSWRNNA